LVAENLGIEAAEDVTAVLAKYVHEQISQLGEPEANFSGRRCLDLGLRPIKAPGARVLI
jgi:hypothetical protein